MTYSQAQSIAILRNLGFRVRSTNEYIQVLKTFQGGYNLGAWLTVDGRNGPLTSAALARSNAAKSKGTGTASAHFSFTEFRCTCKGAFYKCRYILVKRELLQSLEKYRNLAGPVGIVSGYRCPDRNKAVGGASSSQHMYGAAADVNYSQYSSKVKSLHAFAGIGQSASSHKVRHMDRRDWSGVNPTHGTISYPTIWNYSS